MNLLDLPNVPAPAPAPVFAQNAGHTSVPVNHPVLTSAFTDLVTPPTVRREFATSPLPNAVPPMPASFNNGPPPQVGAVAYNGPALVAPFNSNYNPVMGQANNQAPVNPAANPYQQNPHMAYPQNQYQQPYQVQSRSNWEMCRKKNDSLKK